MNIKTRKRKAEESKKRAGKSMKEKPRTAMDSLSDGLLKNVLSYVPSRRYAAQVNRQFHRVVCSLDDEQNIYKLKLAGTENNVNKLNGSSVLDLSNFLPRIFRHRQITSCCWLQSTKQNDRFLTFTSASSSLKN